MEITIDAESGQVTVGKIVITDSLTPSTVVIDPINAVRYNFSPPPYIMYTAKSLTSGIEFCFFENQIVRTDIHLLDTLPTDYYFSGREKYKYRNDILLKRVFENDTQIPPDQITVSNIEIAYKFCWGTASSLYRNGNAFIRIEYKARRELAVKSNDLQENYRQEYSQINSFRDRLKKG